MCHNTVYFTNIQYTDKAKKHPRKPLKARKHKARHSNRDPRPSTCMFIKIEKRLDCVLYILYCILKQNTTATKPYQYYIERGINQTLKD